MKRPFVFALTVLFTSLAARGADPVLPELVWETDGLQGPESVVFDSVRNLFYVSNMGTFGEGETPHDGFISRLRADGTVLEREWVGGFDNPKGLAIVGGNLYVGDDHDLVEVELENGQIRRRFAPADGGPGSFNDCTADAAGNVYVCSARLHTVFRLHQGVFEPWVVLDPTQTGGINGLRAEKRRLLLGGWSLTLPDGTEQLGHLSTIDIGTKAVGRLGTVPLCHIDGIESDGADGYTLTDWLTGDVLHVTAAGVPTILFNLGQGTADHTYLPAQHLLVLPQMKENRVRAFRWQP